MQNEKNPVLAAILSFIITGLGQLYNGDLKKAALFFGGQILVALILWRISWTIGSLVSLGIWAYGIYDAYVSAQTAGGTSITQW